MPQRRCIIVCNEGEKEGEGDMDERIGGRFKIGNRLKWVIR